jgi:hypothetical protein
VQAKPARPRLHLLMLHLLTALVLVLQWERARSLPRLRKRRRGMTRAVSEIQNSYVTLIGFDK